jgi:2-C-methyl-D-erythritol 4-phosphate cytidylyltransferase
MKKIVIIPAGGQGTRSGYDKPKQFVKIRGKELIVYSLETFQKNKQVDEIIVSADRAYFKLLEKLKQKYNLYRIKRFVEGGWERQDSVYNALSSVSAEKNDLIIVHDAARPLLPERILTAAIKTAEKKGNAVVCLKGNNTLARGKNYIQDYIKRENVLYVQTPQIFSYEVLMRAMRKAYEEKFYGTDESSLVSRLGIKVNITDGSNFNFKVTSKEDFKLFESLVQ